MSRCARSLRPSPILMPNPSTVGAQGGEAERAQQLCKLRGLLARWQEQRVRQQQLPNPSREQTHLVRLLLLLSSSGGGNPRVNREWVQHSFHIIKHRKRNCFAFVETGVGASSKQNIFRQAGYTRVSKTCLFLHTPPQNLPTGRPASRAATWRRATNPTSLHRSQWIPSAIPRIPRCAHRSSYGCATGT